MTQPTYKFRHSNISLDNYREDLKYRAMNLRREAADKNLQAQMLEDFAREIGHDLVEVDNEQQTDEI